VKTQTHTYKRTPSIGRETGAGARAVSGISGHNRTSSTRKSTGGGTGAEASAVTGTLEGASLGADISTSSARRHDGAEAQKHQWSRVQQRGGRKCGTGTGAEASEVTNTAAQKAQNYEQCSISAAADRTVRAASASTYAARTVLSAAALIDAALRAVLRLLRCCICDR
jgi:hypothetical protein